MQLSIEYFYKDADCAMYILEWNLHKLIDAKSW